MAARSCGANPPVVCAAVPLGDGFVSAIEGNVKANAAPAAVTVAAIATTVLRCILQTPLATGAVGAAPCPGVRRGAQDG
jgi:hypothetical protein